MSQRKATMEFLPPSPPPFFLPQLFQTCKLINQGLYFLWNQNNKLDEVAQTHNPSTWEGEDPSLAYMMRPFLKTPVAEYELIGGALTSMCKPLNPFPGAVPQQNQAMKHQSQHKLRELKFVVFQSILYFSEIMVTLASRGLKNFRFCLICLSLSLETSAEQSSSLVGEPGRQALVTSFSLLL